jgi:hypothetical protein
VYEVIERSGAWYTYRDKKWNGRDPIFVEVPADPELRRQIEHDVLVAIGAAEPTPDVTTKKAGIRRRK